MKENIAATPHDMCNSLQDEIFKMRRKKWQRGYIESRIGDEVHSLQDETKETAAEVSMKENIAAGSHDMSNSLQETKEMEVGLRGGQDRG